MCDKGDFRSKSRRFFRKETDYYKDENRQTVYTVKLLYYCIQS